MADLERRSIREIERSNREPLPFRDGLANLGREVPAAAPLVQQPRYREIVRLIVASGKIDSVFSASNDHRIGPHDRVAFLHPLQRLP